MKEPLLESAQAAVFMRDLATLFVTVLANFLIFEESPLTHSKSAYSSRIFKAICSCVSLGVVSICCIAERGEELPTVFRRVGRLVVSFMLLTLAGVDDIDLGLCMAYVT